MQVRARWLRVRSWTADRYRRSSDAVRRSFRAVTKPVTDWYDRITDENCQDFGAIIYVDYRGVDVPAIPVVDPCNPRHIIKWTASPSHMKAVDEEIENGEHRTPKSNRTSPYDPPDGGSDRDGGTDGSDIDMSASGL